MAWNPEHYLRFGSERTQPSIDLVNRIELSVPASIVDIGCGPGNSTNVLRQRWPEARITGIDNSPEMIERARTAYPDATWLLAGARDLAPEPQFDLVFSNAVIQWIPDHDELIPRLLAIVNPGGALAVQVPLYFDMPVSAAVTATSRRPRWRDRMRDCDADLTHLDMHRYYDLLADRAARIVTWQTWYAHEMESHEAIVDMIRSTGMRPFLERLYSDDERDAFASEVVEVVREAYPAQRNGRVLFPFKRLFFVAYAESGSH
ncbi:MAG: methyltransferase domain-containing protein [Spirochaetota bacterium]